ncbi:MAG: DNA polymerase III subunit alpha, partial [Nitrospinota bacterium]
THAAGIVIAPKPLTEYVPLYAKGDDVSTQFTMTEVEKLGLLKMDFLGLRTLTVIRKTEDLIRKRVQDFSVERVALDDKKTYRLLSEGKTLGIFQLESSGLRDILKRLGPEVFEDLIAIVALYRPGPLGSGMVDDFIKRKHGTVEISNIIPELDDILKDTYGVIVYQEQVMKIASVVGGFSLGNADLMRRAMGKKDEAEMARLKEMFIEGAKERKIDPLKAEKIFELIGHFAGYGFNKSHSAAYALVSYRTAYLKAHYPKEFMASLISSEMDNTDKVMQRITECREMNIPVLPPDINESQSDFSVIEGKLRFGLAAVKNVGTNAVSAITKGRSNGVKFTSLVDMCERVDPRVVNRKVMESLIKCGAFDSLGTARGVLFANQDNILEAAQRVHKDRKKGQISLFEGLMEFDDKIDLFANEDSWTEKDKLSFEKETLGFYITGHPLARYERDIRHFTNSNTKKIRETSSEGRPVSIAGVISSYRVLKTKKGSLMAFVHLEDMLGAVEVVVFPKLFEKVRELVEGDEPVWVKGSIKEEEEPVKILCEELFPLS